MYGGWCRFKYNFGKIHTYIIFLSIYTKLYAYIFLSQYRDRCLKLKHQICLLELFKFQPDTFPLIPSRSIKLFPASIYCIMIDTSSYTILSPAVILETCQLLDMRSQCDAQCDRLLRN